MNPTNWSDLFKIKIANPNDNFQKHEVVKLLIVMKILKKYSKIRKWCRIYTEFKTDGLRPDIWFENIKNKSVIAYEIQKNYSNEWLKTKTEQYNNYQILNMTLDFIPINLNKLSNNIEELNKQLDIYVV